MLCVAKGAKITSCTVPAWTYILPSIYICSSVYFLFLYLLFKSHASLCLCGKGSSQRKVLVSMTEEQVLRWGLNEKINIVSFFFFEHISICEL